MKNIFTRALTLTTTLMLSAALAGCGSTPASSTDRSAPDTQENSSNAVSSAENAEPESGTAPDSVTAQNDASDLDYIKGKGTLVVGITDFEPMDYKDENGEWIGFDADMAKAFAESLGVSAEFVEIDWDNKVMELEGKTIDCVWNGMTLTPEVTGAMECSNAYCNNAQVIVVPVDKADSFQDKDNIPEVSFAVEAGSAGEAQASMFELEHTPVMAAAMVGEGTGYASLTYTVGLNSEEYGVGFRKGSDLAAALNDFFTASTQDGSMLAIAEKYGVQAALIE